MAKKLNFKDYLTVDYMPGEEDLVKKNAKKRKQDIPTGNTNEDVNEAVKSPHFKAAVAIRNAAVKHNLTGDDYHAVMRHNSLLKSTNSKDHEASARSAAKLDTHLRDIVSDAVHKNSSKANSATWHGHAGLKRIKEEVEIDEALTMVQRLQRSRQFKKYKSRIKLGRERQARRLADEPRLMRRARKAARNLITKRITQDVPKDELTYARRQEIEKRLDKMGPRIEKLAKRMMPKLRKADRDKKRG